MSYILDALRKSDQQRRLGGVPTLAYAPVGAAAPEPPPILFHGLLGVILVIAVGAGIAWLRLLPPEPAVIASIVAKPLELAPLQSVPAALPEAPVKVAPEPALHEPPVAAVLPPALATPVPRRKLSPSARTEARNMPPAVGAASHGVVVATPEGRADTGASGDVAQQKPMASQDMPLSIRQTLPVMSVAVHAYSEQPRDRLVSINGRMLREGDTLAPDLKLEQITPDGMIFSYRGYRFRRGAQ